MSIQIEGTKDKIMMGNYLHILDINALDKQYSSSGNSEDQEKGEQKENDFADSIRELYSRQIGLKAMIQPQKLEVEAMLTAEL